MKLFLVFSLIALSQWLPGAYAEGLDELLNHQTQVTIDNVSYQQTPVIAQSRNSFFLICQSVGYTRLVSYVVERKVGEELAGDFVSLPLGINGVVSFTQSQKAPKAPYNVISKVTCAK